VIGPPGEICQPVHGTVSSAWPRERLYLLPLHLVFIVAITGVALVAVALRVYEPGDGHDAIALVCGLAVVGLAVYTHYVLALPWLSASVAYLVLLWMFHYGLAFTAVLVPDVLAVMDPWQVNWLYWPNVRLSMILGVIGAAGFVGGAGLTAGRRPAVPVHSSQERHDPAMHRAGWLLMLGGIGAAVTTIGLNGGPAVLTLDFYGVLRLVEETGLSALIDLANFGCLLAICGAAGAAWKKPLAVWAGFGCLLLLLGMRYKALVPLCAFVVIIAHRGARIPRSAIAAAVLTVLIIVPVIRALRIVGFSNRDLVNWTEISPLETFTELGGTLRATKTYVDAIEDGEEYLMGASYWAPFDRQVLVRIVPGREPIAYNADPRVPGRLMAREGSVGTSATGEAYFNFGAVGPFLFYGIVGALFGWLERRAGGSPYRRAQLGVAILLLYFNIRGEWLAIPAQATFALLVLGGCYVAARMSEGGPAAAGVRPRAVRVQV
jgi:hypothetical protein